MKVVFLQVRKWHRACMVCPESSKNIWPPVILIFFSAFFISIWRIEHGGEQKLREYKLAYIFTSHSTVYTSQSPVVHN